MLMLSLGCFPHARRDDVRRTDGQVKALDKHPHTLSTPARALAPTVAALQGAWPPGAGMPRGAAFGAIVARQPARLLIICHTFRPICRYAMYPRQCTALGNSHMNLISAYS